MERGDGGYTLVEMLVVLTVFAVVMSLTTMTFNRVVSSTTHLVKQSQTEIEGMIGLELLRLDLENAGIGLATSVPDSVVYHEADPDDPVAGKFNDRPYKALRPVLNGSGMGTNGSDYLVIKGSAVGMSRTAQRWSYLTFSTISTASLKPAASDADLRPGQGERVIVLKETVKDGQLEKELVTDGSRFSFLLGDGGVTVPKAFAPKREWDRYLVYGIDPVEGGVNQQLKRPFNRADYFIGGSPRLPGFCAPGTGRLYKAVMNHDTAGSIKIPLLDCVADMRVLVDLDEDPDKGGFPEDNLVALGNPPGPADLIEDNRRRFRRQTRRVRVFILAHEGKLDRDFQYPVADPQRAIVVGDGALERVWSVERLAATFGPRWRNYRWRLYTIAVHPKNL